MKMCHSEVIKYIKELENRKFVLLNYEKSSRTFSYIEDGKSIIPEYSYRKTRDCVDALDNKIRHLKHLLAIANCSVKVDTFDITIGEALVMLAQLQNKCELLEEMSSIQQKTQHTTYSGKVEIVECNYDVAEAAKDYEQIRKTISSLQVAIDRANLTNYVEVE